jgi:thiol-disulfide isomerase/thioredoxin
VTRWWRNKWVQRAVFALLLAGVFLGVRAWQQRDMVVGRAPQLDGTTIQGQPVSLGSSTRPTLVYFWGTWCPVCRLEEGTIEAISADHPVLTVAMQSGSNADLLRYQQERGLKAPVLNDSTGEQAVNWGVRVTPTFFVVDRQGQIRFRETGYTSEIGLRLRLWWANQ